MGLTSRRPVRSNDAVERTDNLGRAGRPPRPWRFPRPQPRAQAKAHHRRKHRRVWNDKHWRWVPTADGDWRVQGYIFKHKHKPPKHHFRGPGPKPARRRRGGRAAAPATRTRARPAPTRAPSAPPRPTGCSTGPASARRRAGRAARLAGARRRRPVADPPEWRGHLAGPPPVDDEGNPIAPADAWGHDHLWWLDRMVRTNQPLVERMALVFHDWFATSQRGVSKQQQMIDQSNLFRAACFGSFLDLFKAVTVDPAMLQWLNGNENDKCAPNENYGREMMELFSLGADRGAYTEDDIREQARALTGWRNDWSSELGAHNFRFDPNRHDAGTRPSSARPATGAGKTPAGSASSTRSTPPSSSTSSGATSSRTPAPTAPRDELIAHLRGSGWQIRPVARGDPAQPRALRRAADGQTAGRPAGGDAAGARPLHRHRRLDLALRTGRAGRSSGRPTSPAGTTPAGSTPRGCGRAGTSSTTPSTASPSTPGAAPTAPPRPPTKRWPGRSPPGARRRCATSTGPSCSTSPAAPRQLVTANWQQGPYRAMRQNALLQLIGVSPDLILQ